MRKFLLYTVVVIVAAGIGFSVQSAKNRERVRQMAAARDAWEQNVSGPEDGADRAVSLPGPAGEADAAAAAQAPASATPVPAAAAARPGAAYAAGSPMLRALLSAPARFIVEKTLLGRPEEFRRFLSDPRRTRRYLSHPLVKEILSDTALVRRLAGNRAVVDAFLQSPAMQDPRAIQALADSGLCRSILQSPGASALADDPAFVRDLFVNPRTVAWISSHPEAAAAVGRLNQAK
ncbi:MAG: hypothetical protein PHF00_04905 [Elusimicrobia bacterium]|nr:hypothetical protein [Elusimicrobiota bacterium]